MANLHIILCLVIGLYHSNAIPIPTSHPKQKEIKPESELRFGYGMSFQYHGQMLHGLNHYNLLVVQCVCTHVMRSQLQFK